MTTPGIPTSSIYTTTLTARRQPGEGNTLSLNEGYFVRRNVLDWVFAVLVVVGGLFAFARYNVFMDVYEKGILLAAMPATIAMGWFWRPLRLLMGLVTGFALLAIASYQVDGVGSLARAEQVFWLKYFLSSQSAILWMSVLFFMSTIFYWLGMFSKNRLGGRGHGSDWHARTLVRKLLDWPGCRTYSGQQSVRGFCAVLLDDGRLLSLL